MPVKEAVSDFIKELKTILGESLSKAILYGSYARGDANAASDIDIMILVKLNEKEIKAIEDEVYDYAFELEMRYHIDISPIIKNEEHYDYWVDTLPFYRNIHDEGVVVG